MDYEDYWRHVRRIADPMRSPFSELIAPYLREGDRRLEIGAGMRPKFPLEGTVFLEGSPSAVAALRSGGAEALVHDLSLPLPFPEATFDLVGAFEVLEHLPDDRATCREIARVLKPGGFFLFSVPVSMRYWTAWDTFVGHQRRYEAAELTALLGDAGFRLERWCGLMSFTHRLQRTMLYRFLAASAVLFARAAPAVAATVLCDFGCSLLERSSRLRNRVAPVCWRSGPLDASAFAEMTNIIGVCTRAHLPG